MVEELGSSSMWYMVLDERIEGEREEKEEEMN